MCSMEQWNTGCGRFGGTIRSCWLIAFFNKNNVLWIFSARCFVGIVLAKHKGCAGEQALTCRQRGKDEVISKHSPFEGGADTPGFHVNVGLFGYGFWAKVQVE